MKVIYFLSKLVVT